VKALGRTFVPALILAVLAATAHAITAPVNPQGLNVERSLQEAAEVGKKGDTEKSYAMLKERIAVPEFARLEQNRQYMWLHLVVVLGLRANDWEYTHAKSRETTAMPQANKDDWTARFFAASFLEDRKDALYALLNIARKFPEALATYDDRYTAKFARDILAVSDAFDRRRLLEALYAAKWTFKGGIEPSYFWSELAALYIEKNENDKAKEVAARITSPRTLIAMRVDKRFDALVSAVPDRFDVMAAVDRELAALEQASKASPRLLSLISQRLIALADAGRYEAAVAVSDEILKNARTPEEAAKQYDDAAAQFNWVLDYRAQALQGLGKHDEAEKYLKDAASRLEDGAPNVSNVINLALFYARLGRSREAVATLGDLAKNGEGVSPYGQMQIQLALLQAALASKDAKAARVHLETMRKNEAASPGSLQEALLYANEMEEAARLLIARLKDPVLRSDALSDLQDYQKSLQDPSHRLLQQRWRALRSRPDVQKAIAEVGRVETYPLPPALT
jgi:hypothetical protein